MSVKLGALIEGDARRDAVHVAVFVATCKHQVFPGMHVGLVEGRQDEVEGGSQNPIGIVNPFLSYSVPPDTEFEVMLYPGTVTGMRHHWEHPAFTNQTESAMGDSEKWLRDFAERSGLLYGKFVEIIKDYSATGEGWVEYGSGNARDEFYHVDKDEFWKHVKAVIGVDNNTDAGSWGTPFSCSC